MDFGVVIIVVEGFLKLFFGVQVYFNRVFCKIFEFMLGRRCYVSNIVIIIQEKMKGNDEVLKDWK